MKALPRPSARNDIVAVRVGADRWGFVFEALKERYLEPARRELIWFFGGPRELRVKGAPKRSIGHGLKRTAWYDAYERDHGKPHPDRLALDKQYADYSAFTARWRHAHPVEARRLRFSFTRLRLVVDNPKYEMALRSRFLPLDGEGISLKTVSTLGWASISDVLDRRSEQYYRRWRSYIA